MRSLRHGIQESDVYIRAQKQRQRKMRRIGWKDHKDSRDE